MPKIPFWFRSLLFIVVFSFLFSALQSIFTTTFHSEVYVLEQMIDDHESFDIVILGSSHAYCSFDPAIIDAVLANTETVNFSTPNISFAHSALLLKQMIDEGKVPQVVVLELYSMTSIMEDTTQVSFFNNYSKTWQPDYLQWIVGYYAPDQLMAPLFPLIHQHETWKNPGMLTLNIDPFTDKEAVIRRAVKMTKGYANDGFRDFPMVISNAEYDHSQQTPMAFHPTKANLRALEQILSLGEAYGFRTLLVQAPFPMGYNSDYAELDAVTQKYGLTTYPLNQTLAQEYSYLDFLNATHLNAHGAIPTSITLAQILSKELERPLDQTRIAPYRELRLADINLQHIGTWTKVTLIPASPTSDWQVDWAFYDGHKKVMLEQSGPYLNFSIPRFLLTDEESYLSFTITQAGFDYPLTLELSPENFNTP